MSRSVTMPRSSGPPAISRCRMRFWIMSWRASSTGVSGLVVIGLGVMSSATVMGPPLATLLRRIGSGHAGAHLLHLGPVLLHHAAHSLVHLHHLAVHGLHLGHLVVHLLHLGHLVVHLLHLVFHLVHHLHHAHHALVVRAGRRSLRQRQPRQRDQERCRREARDQALHGLPPSDGQ